MCIFHICFIFCFILSGIFISYFCPKPAFGSTSTTVCYKACWFACESDFSAFSQCDGDP